VVRVTPFDTGEEAILLANATKHAPTAYIWTSDLQRAHRLAPAIESVATWGELAQPAAPADVVRRRRPRRRARQYRLLHPVPDRAPRRGRPAGAAVRGLSGGAPPRRTYSSGPDEPRRHPPSCCAGSRMDKMTR
jgi:hypothetical protein